MHFKKFISLILIGSTLGSPMTLFATTTPHVTEQDATAIAYGHLPKGTQHIQTELDDESFEVEFLNAAMQEKYTFEVSAATGAIEAVETENFAPPVASNTVTILTADQIKAIIHKELPGVEITDLEMEKDDIIPVYEVEFTSDKVSGEYEIQGILGTVLERELELTKQTTIPPVTEPTLPLEPVFLPENVVMEQVYLQLPKGTQIIDSEYKDQSYHLDFRYQGFYISFTVDAVTGETQSVEAIVVATTKEVKPNSYLNGRYVPRLAPQEVTDKLKHAYPTLTIGAVEVVQHSELWVYAVNIQDENADKKFMVCPEAGKIIGYYQSAVVQPLIPLEPAVKPTTPLVPLEPAVTPDKEPQPLTIAEIEKILATLVPQGIITDIELDNDDNEWVYEVEMVDNKFEYAIELCGETGSLIEMDREALEDDDDNEDDDDED